MLFLTLFALALGPLLAYASRRSDALRSGLDGFVYVAIAGLVLTQILPEALALCGWIFLLPFLGGLILPGLFERALVRRAPQAHAITLFIGLVGLVVHNAVDGLALLGSGVHAAHDGVAHDRDGAQLSLGLAVALHQLPVGLMVWLLLRPNYGRLVAALVLAALCAATAAGYFFGEGLVDEIESRWSGMLQALVGGSLLHVVMHGHAPVAKEAGPRAAGIGGLLGLALVAGLVVPHARMHGHDHGAAEDAFDRFIATFVDLSLASAPSLVLGYLVAGLIQAFLPKATVGWLNRGSRLMQAWRGVVFGLPLPVCSCGVLPIYRTIVQKGAAPAAALAFLVATPELGVDAVILSFPMLGAPMAIARVVTAAVVALLVGMVLSSLGIVKPAAVAADGAASTEPQRGSRWAAFRDRLLELFDSTSPWILLGLVVAALIDPMIADDRLTAVPGWVQLPLCALIGMPLYVCASGATPLVAMLMAKGLSPGAAIVFLLVGPATNVTTFGVMAKLHDRRTALWFAAAMATFTIVAGVVVNLLIGETTVPPIAHEHDHGTASFVATAAALGLVLMTAWSLLRLGPRAYMSQIGSASREPSESVPSCCATEADDHGDHDHGHGGHGHDHGDTKPALPAMSPLMMPGRTPSARPQPKPDTTTDRDHR